MSFQVFDALRTTMFILGMVSVFIGISLLAPDEPKGMFMVEQMSMPILEARINLGAN